MHVALVLMKYNPHGGYERQAKLLADALAEKGHEVSILSSRWTEESNDRVQFVKIKICKLASWLKVLSFARNVKKHLHRHADRYDHVIAFDRSLGMDVYRAGSACHREWLRLRKETGSLRDRISILINPLNAVINRIEKKIFQRMEQENGKIVVLSRQGARQIQAYYPVSDERFTVIPPAIDFARFQGQLEDDFRQQQRKDLGVGENEIALLFVGSGFRIKGLEKLLYAVELLASKGIPVRLFVVGNDRKGIARYQPVAESLGIGNRVMFTGGVQDVGRYYAASDIFVMLSLLETFNAAVIEAMSFGLPVVVSEGAGVSDMIENDALGKRLSVSATPENVAGAILEQLEKSAQEDSKQDRAARRNVARQCELGKVVSRYLDLIEA